MHTIREVRRRAKADLRRWIYKRGLFRPARLKTLAQRLARAYAGGLSDGALMALARHESWLEAGKCEDVGRIESMLFHYLRRELRRLARSFWEGHTSVELAVKDSRVQASEVRLVGFFNGERPTADTSPNAYINAAYMNTAHMDTTYSDAARSGSFEEAPQNQQVPYA